MAQLDGDQAVNLAVAVGLGGILGKLVDWWLGRGSRRRTEAAAATDAGAEFQRAVSESAKLLLADYRDQLGFVRAEQVELARKVDACEARHADCEKNVARLTARLDRLTRKPPGRAKP